MATRNSNGKLKSNLLRLLVVILMICLSAFTFVACNNPVDDDETDYPITESDAGIISNASFEYGSADLELKDFPQSAPKNWSIIGDNSSRASAVTSGIVNVTADGWDSLLNKLYDDDDFLNYCTKKFDINLEQIKTENNNDATKVKEAVVEILKTKFASPSTHDANAGDKVLMINNYLESARFGLGTAQKATSSSTVTIEKATNAKITVWVKTQNLVGIGNYGANIRINTSVNSTTTNVFAIYGIRDTEWTQYTFYVRGDAHYSSTITLVLGLGFGNTKGTDFVENYTEGTAYFDDISYETVATVPSSTQYSINLNDSGDVYVPSSVENPVFSLRVNDSITSKTNINLSDSTIVTHDFHKSNIKQGNEYLTSKTILGAENSTVGEVSLTSNQIYVKNLVNASYAVDIASPDFAVAPESYAYLTFKVTNELGRLDKHGVTVYVYDYNGNEETITSIGRAIYSDGKSSQFNIVIKNNFPELDAEGNYPTLRYFKLKIVIGATDITSASTAADFSNGGARISDMSIHYGKTYQYERTDYTSDSYVTTTNELEDYGTYKFVSSACTDDTVSLYAGNSADFTASASTTYSINSAPSDIGTITSRPAIVNGYEGISSDHVYITNESTNADINTNANAGVINTKYLNNYSLAGIKEALNHTGKNDIQPLMIYNATASSYGYVGKNLSIAQSAYALISLKIRVVGDAKASIYLVDVSSTAKDVMSINFKNNTTGYNYITDGVEHSYDLAFENITADMMETTGASKGWLTLTFYVGAGNTAKNFRLEMWNGSRTGDINSQGFVFINDITITTTDAFKEPTDWLNLDNSVLSSIDRDNAVLYRRPLDQTEIKFNNDPANADKLVSYSAKYVWAKSDSIIYAIYNTIDPVPVDPYETDDDSTDDGADTGCTAQTDPSTFWLSFSSIVLVVAIVFALIMLIVKRVLNKRKKAPKAKSAYNVSSRQTKPAKEKAEKVKKDMSYDEYEDEKIEEPVEEVEQTPETNEPASINPEEQTIEEFVYGDVQDFGDYEDNSDKDN
ncbi:MAG: hypothetical protein E7362_05150 [Clostridiales bacterium]|nr:hypothetical protein [Clostridiales bacterium]